MSQILSQNYQVIVFVKIPAIAFYFREKLKARRKMTTIARSVSIRVPSRTGSCIRLGRYGRLKMELSIGGGEQVVLSGNATEQNRRGLRSRSQERAASRTSVSTEVGVGDSLTIGGAIQREIERDLTVSVGASLDINNIERVAASVVNGASRGAVLNSLFGGVKASLNMGNTSYTISPDSDFCFIGMSGSIPYRGRIGGLAAGFNIQSTIKMGLSATFFKKVIESIYRRCSTVRIFLTKLRGFFAKVFGSGAVARSGAVVGSRIFRALRTFLRGARLLEPWMWAIDIALFIRDTTLFLCRRAARAGHREGLTMTFATAFARTIFNVSFNFSSLERHRQMQQYAADVANRYHGERRRAVQNYLVLFYSNTHTRRASRNSGNAIAIGELFQEGLLTKVRSADEAHVLTGINNYFNAFINPWVRSWQG